MDYEFLIETYDQERLKTLNVWSTFRDDEMDVRLPTVPARDRTAHEHWVHQCLSEDKWFQTMFGITVPGPTLPNPETRLGFIEHYARVSGERVAALRTKPATWWAEETAFFDVQHSRAWIMVRRVAHTAHHRGEQTALLRLLGHAVHSVYGPAVDTGGLPANGARTIYAYPTIEALLEGEKAGGRKAPLPGPGEHPSTERPNA